MITVIHRDKKGFTLIELLVVVAIIGILAAMVLVALNVIQYKGEDARLQSDFQQMRTLAQTYFMANRTSYVGFDECLTNNDPTSADDCATDISLDQAAQSLRADVISGTPPHSMSVYTNNADSTVYCAETPLISNASKFICIDNTGVQVLNESSVCAADNVSCTAPITP